NHLIHHELTHAVIYDLIFGGSFSSIISRQRFFNLPLWFAEGYAEYSSRDHWHYRSDMIVRDATINSYLRPPGVMGILAYTEGSMLVRYIADTYGEEKLGEILRKGKILLSIKRAVKAATGVEIKKIWADYQLYLKQRYWPEIAERKMPDKISKQLTKHGRDGSYFNEKPAFSPNGDVIAIFSDRADYTEIFLISATDGRVVKKVTKASRSGDLESLHSFFSGITFSPDGEKLCFVAKSNGYDALFFMNIANRKVYLKKRVNAYGLLSPIWSPEGDRVAFSALMNGRRDMFIFDIEQDILTPLTNDLHDDRDASWMLDGRTLVFSSDRPHPENNEERDVQVDLTENFLEAGGGPLRFGAYNLFTLNIDTREVTPLPVGEGHNIEPAVSPDGKKIVFVSNRNGIDNLYLHYFDSTGAIAITDLLTGAGSPSWAPTGKKIAFSSFNSGGFDVFLLEDIFPAGNQGELELTDFYLGKFRKDYVELDANDEALNLDAPIWSPKTLGWEESGGEKQKPPVSLVADSESSGVATISTDTSGITSDGDFVFVSGPSKTASDGDSGSDADNGEKGQSEREDPEDDPFAPSHGGDPLSPLLTDVPDDDLDGVNRGRFDVRDELSPIEGNREGDEYVVKPYKVKFTPDFVAGGLNFDSFFGLRSQGFFLLSDYLGNRQILIGADVSGDIDRSNVQAYYFDNTRRTRLGTGLFHTKNFYLDNRSRLFSDRFFGATGLASYPFSTFSRVDFSATLTFVSRNYHNAVELRDSRTTRAATLGLSYTHDNVLWGLTGPVNGGRSKLTFSVAKDFFSNTHRVFRVPNPRSRNDSIAVAEIFRQNPSASLDSTVSALYYLAVELDHRRYWH
ncbi:MAG: PD40 domain-containing protein, partial [candidate division Zixibacteria bacterium]|nr:PD40 domain-containing protein [candidate division Zixibacteria bacterium]